MSIAVKTACLMQSAFAAEPKDMLAGFGPSIRSCCYEVEAQFNDFFPGQVAHREGKYFSIWPRPNKGQLLRLGIQEKNIADCGICTSCRSLEFFSFRKESISCGRMLSVIMLK